MACSSSHCYHYLGKFVGSSSSHRYLGNFLGLYFKSLVNDGLDNQSPYRCLHHSIVFIQYFYIGTCISAKIEFDIGVSPDVLDSNILEAWFVQVLVTELLNHFKSINKIGNRFLGPFTHFVILPLNKILQFFTIDTRTKDFRSFEFFFAINLDWR